MSNNIFSEFNVDKTTYNDIQRSNLNSPPPRTNLDYNINDTYTKSSTKKDFSADDGKISFKDKLKNFAKGIVSPITTMFSSPKNFAIGAASIVGISVLTAATGGAITPLLIASGVTMGGIQIARSAYNAATAATDDEARQAWQGMGAGTTAVAGSVAGAKGALKASGVDTANMSALEATLQCFKSVPSSIGKSFNAFKTGAALTNIKNAFGINKKESSKGTKTDNKSLEETENIKNETKTETKPDVKAEHKPEVKADSDTAGEVKTETKTKQPKTRTEVKTEAETQTTKPEVKAEQKPEAKTETKPTVKAETKSDVKAETKTGSDIAGEVKTETKTKQPEARTEVKTEAETQTTKPAAAASDKTTLKDITFKNGKATTSTGENFTGTIEDTLNNGKKVKLTYKDGVFSDSVITDGKTTVHKYCSYKNGQLEATMTRNGYSYTDIKNFSYDENGKIIEIYNGMTDETKNLLYDTNGSYKGYELKSQKNGTIQTYSKDGSLIETKKIDLDFNFSEEEITEAVQKLKNNSSDIKEIKLKDGRTETVVRKTKVLNRNTGKYEDMYITSDNNRVFRITTADGTQYGTMTLKNTSTSGKNYTDMVKYSSDAYKALDFVEVYQLQTDNLGMGASQYKGLGTELLKQAVIESYDEGHLGRIGLVAANDFEGIRVAHSAESFYTHIGMTRNINTNFTLPEYDIAQFLSR